VTVNKSDVVRTSTAALLAALLVSTFAASAHAQSVGARAGVSVDPDQFYFGGHVETAPLIDRLRFRPNIEIGVGDDRTLVAFNFEFAYHFPSQGTWNVYAGAGPALNLLRFRGETDAGGGLNLLMGVQHNRGLFAEFKVGTVDSPRVKFAVGYAVRWQ
jgi:hypothetical protein